MNELLDVHSDLGYTIKVSEKPDKTKVLLFWDDEKKCYIEADYSRWKAMSVVDKLKLIKELEAGRK